MVVVAVHGPTIVFGAVFTLLAEHIRGDVLELQIDAVVKIRKLVSPDNAQAQQVLALNIMDRFVHFLTSESAKLQFESAWVLTNIASGSSAETRAVVDAGAVPRLVALMRSPHKNVREQAIWALSNIAGDCPVNRDLILSHGAMPLLLDCFGDSSQESLVRIATHALSNLCRGKPQPSLDVVQSALGVLGSLIRGDDAEVLSDACWALSHLSDGKVDAVLDAGVLPRVIQLLDHKESNVQAPALRCIGNIVTGNEQQTQRVVDANALVHLAMLLKSPAHSICKEACWAISNITAGNQTQIQAVIDSGVVPTLVSMLRTSPLDVKKEACWALSNATSKGSQTQIDFLVQCDMVPPLLDIVGVPGDNKIISVAVEGLENTLRSSGPATEQAVRAGLPVRLKEVLFRDVARSICIIERCAAADARSILDSDVLSEVASLPHADLTLETKQSIARTVILCYNSATPAQRDDLADTGMFNHMYVIRDRAATICIGLQDLELPALVTLELLDAAFPNDIPMHKKWQLVTAAKHFHQRREIQ
jgi:importin subunit alpha-6/7